MIGRVRAREGDSRAIDRVHARTKVFTNIAAPPLARDGQLPAQVARVLKLPPTRQDGGLEHRPATSPRPSRLHGKLPARTSPRPPSRAAPYPTSFVPDYPPFFTLRARRRWRRAQLTATPPPVFAENACDWTAGRRLDNSTYKKICATSPRPTIHSLPSVDGSGDEILRHGTRGGLTLEHLHRALHRRDPLVVRREFGPAVKHKRLREERHLMEHSP